MRTQLSSAFFIIFFPLALCAAGFKFGGENSSIKVAAGSTLNVASDATVTGVISKEVGATITGDGSLVFNSGVFNDEGVVTGVTGSFSPTDNKLTLTGDQWLHVEPGQVLADVEVSGTSNLIKGDPTFSSAVTLVDSDSELTLAVGTAINQNIALNGGTLSLANDASFADDEFLIGPGTLNTNTRRLHTGGVGLAANTDLTFATNSHLVLNAPVTLSGTWRVNGNVYVQGNGSTFDLSTGQIIIEDGATLTLTDVQLHNWGTTDDNGPRILLSDGVSKLRLAQVEALLVDSVTYDQGTVEVFGNSLFVLKDKQLLFDGASLEIAKGARLSYDTVEYDFATLNSAAMTIHSTGELDDVNSAIASAPLVIDVATTLSTNIAVMPTRKMTISLDNSGQMVVGFAGHHLAFSNATSTQLDIITPNADTAEAYLTDVVVQNYVPDAVAVSPTATLTFGTNSRVELGGDQTLIAPLNFHGTCTLDGKGSALTISETNNIQAGADTTLIIKDITLRGVTGAALQCLANSGTIVCDNVTIEMAGDTTFDAGSFQTKRGVTIMGAYRFVYESPQAALIHANSTLTMAPGTTYVYDPSDDTTGALQFTDSTANLTFDTSTFEVADTGVLLTKGVITINNTVTFNSLASNLAGAVVLGDGVLSDNNMAVKIGSRATLCLNAGVVQVDDAA